MIFRRLMEYEQRHSDTAPIGYARKTVNYAIKLTGDGTAKGKPVALSGIQTKSGRQGKEMVVPSGKRSGTKPPPYLLVDDARYVLGVNSDKFEGYHQRFCELVYECAAKTNLPVVHAVATWLRSEGPRSLLATSPLDASEVVCFIVDDQVVTDLPEVQDFWASKARAATASKSSQTKAQCLITGKQTEPTRILPLKIRGVPNTNQGQGDLTSFNESAFRSYGLEQTQNAPMDPEAARLVVNGLNRLLRSEHTRLYLGDVVYCFWTRKPVEFSLVTLLNDPRPEDVAALLSSPRGGRPTAAASADFFVLALSGSKSRIVIRDYHETTLDNVKANLKSWFERLEIVGPDGASSPPFGVFRLAVSLFREAKDIPAHVPTALVATAVAGSPLPDYLLGLAVKRNLAMQGPYSIFNKKRYLSLERLAIIKALLTQGKEDNLKGLNPEHPDSAYHCGRLLAVLERIQKAALGDINATIVDRYYGAACASPGTILGNLVNDAQAHLGKLRKEHKDFHHQNRLMDVLTAIGDEFPRTLSLPRQGLFALGFYHQKADDRAAAIKHKELQVADDDKTTEAKEGVNA